jgi:riboflavin kinase / FMN adenylyltransferase
VTADLPVGDAGSVVTVGTFDGIHRGHQAVLDEIARRAAAAGRKSVLVTFDPHPLTVVRPDAAPALLTTWAERREVLATTALDYALVLRFDETLRAMSPERFVIDVLLARCGMRDLVIGYDHAFGRGRSGDTDTLRELGARYGFTVDVVGEVDIGGEPVSSSRVRRAVAAGDLARAAELLGRRYSVSGTVGPGAARGRQIGVPTINLADLSPRKLLPPDGVYAVRVEWAGGRAGGMLNQGGRPTFGEAARTLEAHLFGVDADLYGARVRIEWVAHLREIQRFDSPDRLREQLARDRENAEAALAAADANPDRVSSHA